MNERENEATPAGSIDARVDVILREIVGGEGAADMRSRVMAAIPKARHRERRVGTLPWRWIAVAGSLAAGLGVAVVTGWIPLPASKPQVVSTGAEAPRPGPKLAARVVPRIAPTTGIRPVARSVRRETQTPRTDWEQEVSLAPIEISPIEGTNPLDLPPLRTANIEAPSLTLPALAIDALPTEPTSNGSF